MSETIEHVYEPSSYRQGWYDVRVDYHKGHKPAVVDIARLATILPHGSGIDGDWHVFVRRNGDVCVSSSYHAMNDVGYYAGWRNFRFTLARAKKNEYTALIGPCSGQYQVTRKTGTVYLQAFLGGGDASDYLYDCVSIALADEMDIHAITSDTVNSIDAAEALR